MKLPRFLRRRPVVEAPVAPTILPAPAPAVLEPRQLEALTPAVLDIEARIALATRCRDADPLAKCPGAGSVFQREGQRLQRMFNGLEVQADGYYGPWMTRLIELCRGHHEPQEEVVFQAVIDSLPPGGAMVELGGYWGFYSAWFLTAAPGRRALLVEPDPAHIAVGQANMALNKLEAEFIQGFMGATPGEARDFATEESGTLRLPCIDLPALLAGHGIDRLAILHCDAQGAEFTVLEQMAPWLGQGRVDWVFVSTHHHVISGDPLIHQRCLALLRGLGAQVLAEHDVQESFSGDGLICARFGPVPDGWKAPRLSYCRTSESLFRNPLYDLAQKH